MRKPRFDAKTLVLIAIAIALVLAGAVVSRLNRRNWTDHDVSDPGVTL
jgi:cytochrome c-type biogenesis protein CcmH/NrfF